MGIEPTSSAWKAEVLPLNYTRSGRLLKNQAPDLQLNNMVEGGGFEPPKPKQQIYSLPPLTAREPLRTKPRIILRSLSTCQHTQWSEYRYNNSDCALISAAISD